MFRQILSILFLLAFAVQTFQQNLIVGSYYLNTAMYARNCENKTKPASGCKGKCQMMKKLQQEEQKQAPAPGMKAEQKGETFTSSSSISLLSIPHINDDSYRGFAFSSGKPLSIALSIFHPPSLV